MINPNKFNPPEDIIKARREAILEAVQSARQEKEKDQKDTPVTPFIPYRGFPISLSTHQLAETHLN